MTLFKTFLAHEKILGDQNGWNSLQKALLATPGFDWGGSPGLVVMGGDSLSKGCGFESRHRILDGHFFTYICCKNL